MKVSLSGKSWKRIVAVSVLSAGVLAFGGAKAFAQDHDQRHEKHDFKDHQKMERRAYGNSAVRDHQRAEKDEFKHQERAERSGYYGGYYGGNGGYAYPPYGGSQYPSGHGGHSYPNIGGYHGDGYPSEHGIYGYPSEHGQYHGNWHSPAVHDSYHHDNHY